MDGCGPRDCPPGQVPSVVHVTISITYSGQSWKRRTVLAEVRTVLRATGIWPSAWGVALSGRWEDDVDALVCKTDPSPPLPPALEASSWSAQVDEHRTSTRLNSACFSRKEKAVIHCLASGHVCGFGLVYPNGDDNVQVEALMRLSKIYLCPWSGVTNEFSSSFILKKLCLTILS